MADLVHNYSFAPGQDVHCKFVGKAFPIVWRSCCVFGWHLGFSPLDLFLHIYFVDILNDSAYVPSLIDSAC